MAKAWKPVSAEQRALSCITRLEAIPSTYKAVDKFLLEIEAFGKRFGKEDELLMIAESRMGTVVVWFYERRMKVLCPEKKLDFKALAYVMSKLVSFKTPESILDQDLDVLEGRSMDPLHLYTEVCLAYDAYVRLCERTESPVQVTEDSLQSKYISLLDFDAAEEVTEKIGESPENPDILLCAQIAFEYMRKYKAGRLRRRSYSRGRSFSP